MGWLLLCEVLDCFDRDLELALAHDVEVTHHLAAVQTRLSTQRSELVGVSPVSFLYFVKAVVTDKSLVEDVLVSDVLVSLKHSCHSLQVVLGQ